MVVVSGNQGGVLRLFNWVCLKEKMIEGRDQATPDKKTVRGIMVTMTESMHTYLGQRRK
jgi:hypothetical protein